MCGWSSPLESSANFCFALLLFVLYMCCEQIKQLRGAEMNSSIISSNTYKFSCIYDCFLPMTVYLFIFFLLNNANEFNASPNFTYIFFISSLYLFSLLSSNSIIMRFSQLMNQRCGYRMKSIYLIPFRNETARQWPILMTVHRHMWNGRKIERKV